jgi:toxin ParE1/3/4
MRLRWSPQAAADFDQIYKRIQKNSPATAQRVVRRLYDGIETLTAFPNRGRTGRAAGTRELVFAGLPYLAVYRVRDEAVEIVRIWHGAQSRKPER